ncbi:MAG: hypothetical protein ACI8XG_000055 [Congregibacter sp.]|jgi:hypothetical protein
MVGDHLHWIYPIISPVACSLVFLSLYRLGLILWQLERVTEAEVFSGLCHIC